MINSINKSGITTNNFETTHLDDFEKTGFIADYLKSGVRKSYGIIVLGGSEGGKPSRLARKIATMGYNVLSLAYFKEGNVLPKNLEMIPLEYFSRAKNWLLARDEVKNEGIILIGWSKGAELALLLASQENTYKAIIGIAPSSVVWPGVIDDWYRRPLSSWSKNNTPLPHIPFAPRRGAPKKLSDLYQESLDVSTIPMNTTLDFRKIKIPVLLLSGGLDTVWPASNMAKIIYNEINKNSIADFPLCTHYDYPNAGHLLDETFNLGGTKEDNYLANKDAYTKMNDFLKNVNQ